MKPTVPEAYLPAMQRIKELWFYRDDVYAEAWVTWDTTTTPPTKRMAYTPKKFPISLDIIYRHAVEKRVTIGAYQFRPDGTVKWICWDVDDDLKREDRSYVQETTLQLLQALRTCGVDAATLLEDSGNKGYHVWLFFQTPVEGRIAQRLGLHIRDQVVIPDGIHIEVFPKNERQDGFGSLVKLPFSKHPKTDRQCQLVDPGFVPRDSIPAIDGVAPLGRDELAALVHDLGLGSASESEASRSSALPGQAQLPSRGLPCTTELLEAGVAQGERQEATFRLAYRLKNQGLPEDLALKVLGDWDVNKNQPPLSSEAGGEFSRASQNGFAAKGLGCKSDFMRQHCHADCPVYKKIYAPGDGPDASNDSRRAAQTEVPQVRIPDLKGTDDSRKVDPGPPVPAGAEPPGADPAALLELRYIRSDPDKGLLFQRDGLEYWVRGKLERCRVDIIRDGRKVAADDRINLSQSRARTSLAKDVTKAEKDLTIEQILNDLVMLEDLYRVELRRAAGVAPEDRPRVRVSVSPEEEKAATDLLKSPDLLFRVHQAIERMGVAGEWENRLTLYLAYTSRLLASPIQIAVKGSSSSGKSWMTGRVLRLMPAGSYTELTDATPQALLYLDEDKDLRYRILVFFELQGGEKSDYKIRTLQSEGELRLWVPIKDPATNEIKTVEKVVPGPVQITTTTTEFMIHPENETRLLSLYVSDSAHRTKQVREIQGKTYKGEKVGMPEQELAIWHAAQTILKPYPVLIPYVDDLEDVFPMEPVRVRRDYARFLTLIAIVTVLHQYQREHRELHGETYVVADLVDYEYARILAGKIFGDSMTGVSPKARELRDWLAVTPPFSLGNDFVVRDIAVAKKTSEDTARRVLNQLVLGGALLRKAAPQTNGAGARAIYSFQDRALEEVIQLPPAGEIGGRWALRAGSISGPAALIHPFSGEISELTESAPQAPQKKEREINLPPDDPLVEAVQRMFPGSRVANSAALAALNDDGVSLDTGGIN